MTIRLAHALVAAAFTAGCASAPLSNVAPARRGPTNSQQSPISHVVFIVQENRSFNNLFMGYPGATTARYGYDRNGRKISLHAQNLGSFWDIDHSFRAFVTACDGRGKLPGTDCRMDGWNDELTSGHPAKNFAYAYVPRDEIRPYWEIARKYVLADRAFASNLDGSFVAHQYAVAAYADRAVDYPSQPLWGCEGGPTDTVPTLSGKRTYRARIRACFDIPTIASEADAAGVSWRFYTGAPREDGGQWSSYQADRAIFRGPDWKTDVINPPKQFLTDIAGGALANVTWITPVWEDSDHPGLPGSNGPSWVASLVNAVGASKFWKTTTVFVIWDDWGGWFDPVKPVDEDYDGLGFRVPLLVVSPYAKRGYVTHVQYETSSVLRYIEDNFGLAPLAASDSRANDPVSDALDYRMKPRAFEKIGGGEPAARPIAGHPRAEPRGLPPGND